MACQNCHKKKVKCVFSPRARKCDLCRKMGVPCNPHVSRQGQRTDIDKKGSSFISERKDESSGGDNISASLPRRGELLPFSSDRQNTMTMKTLDVFSQGKRFLWFIGDTNSLKSEEITRRITMDKVGVCTYIICTCVSKLPSSGNGTLCIFTLRRRQPKTRRRQPKTRTCPSWHLAIVESFCYVNEDGTDTVHLLEWTGPVTSTGQPAFYTASTFQELTSHFTRKSYDLHSLEFYYVNLVRGSSFASCPISDATRSVADGGIQCNPDGPDRVPTTIKIPVHRKVTESFSLTDLSVITSSPFLTKSTPFAQKRKKEQDEFSSVWSKPPNRIPKKDAVQCAILVSAEDGSFLRPNDIRLLGDADNLFFFPSPFVGSATQEFFGISQLHYSSVVKAIDGISLDKTVSLLRSYAKKKFVLCNASSLAPQDHPHQCHQYTRVFLAGDVSPDLSSEDITTIHLPSLNRRITYGIISSKKLWQYIPLSVGLIDNHLHGISVPNYIITRMSKCLGKNGIFPQRPCSAHRNSLSFIGPRSMNTCAQPNPSEGDIQRFWYFRKHLNQAWWCLVLKVVNSLTSNLVSLPLREFFYLSKLLPHLFPNSFQDGSREFCRFAILTVNFVNAVHVDIGDLFGSAIDAAALSLLSALLVCNYLSDSLRLQVKATIHHIHSFGLSSPTTCGYQIASENRDVEAVQFFIAFGLGVCYQIQNGWTHTFLAATHSHMTSAALYVLDGKVYASFPNCNVLAWGKGKERGGL